jgi:glucosamine kinase
MHTESSALVLGMDVGATTSRAIVCDLQGRAIGGGAAGGGNPNSHPPEQAVRQIVAAARAALADVDPARVRAGVVGMAGVSTMTDPTVARELELAWQGVGLSPVVRVISDCEVAFAAGSASAVGTVLIAGTGAIAGRIAEHRLIATVGGHGWLLGDEGSAFWVGREAVRHALRTLDRGAPSPGGLTTEVCEHLLGATHLIDTDITRKKLITSVTAAPPIRLAELAPLVTSAARRGRRAAVEIVDRAAALLADTARSAHDGDAAAPIVLAGGLVAAGNPIGDALRAQLTADRCVDLRTAGPGAAGAAWLAAHDLLGPELADDLHPAYLRTASW